MKSAKMKRKSRRDKMRASKVVVLVLAVSLLTTMSSCKDKKKKDLIVDVVTPEVTEEVIENDMNTYETQYHSHDGVYIDTRYEISVDMEDTVEQDNNDVHSNDEDADSGENSIEYKEIFGIAGVIITTQPDEEFEQ